MKISRRKFLAQSSAVCAASLVPFYKPSLVIAEGPGGGAGQFFINVLLGGGADGLFMLPPADALFDSLKARRPTIMNGIAQADVAFGGSPIGTHPLLAETLSAGMQSVRSLIASGNGRIISRVGLPQMDGSHDSAMATLLTGMSGWTLGSNNHWVGRWMDAYDMQPTQVWRLGKPIGFPLTRSGPPPITVDDLSQYSWNDRGSALGGSVEGALSRDLARQLLALQQDLSPIQEELKAALLETHDTWSTVWEFKNEASRSDYSFPQFRDAAKIIRKKFRTGDSSVTYIQISLGGFDHHSYLASGLGSFLQIFNRDIQRLYEDLKVSGWSRTALYVSTEFGRKIPTGAESGADHGWANNLLVLGGGLRSGVGPVAGTPLDPTEIASANVMSAGVDHRMAFWEILEFLGHDPARVFPGFSPTAPQRLNLFTA